MMAHVYRLGESDDEGLHQETTRVTLLDDTDAAIKFRIVGKALVLGTLPRTTAIPMNSVRWFWVEES